MAKIEKLKKDVEGVSTTIYPVTIPQAVIDPTSGKSAREELDEKANHGYASIEVAKTLKQVDDDLVQLESEVNLFKEESNLKDAIQDSKIKDIESIISTMNPNQSAQLSVSGVSPLSLPKNAANGGMSVKLEGLTVENEAVNGNLENGLIAPFRRYDFSGESTLAINSSAPISGNYDIRLTITTADSSTYLAGLNRAGNIGDKIYLHFYAKILSGTPIIRSIHEGTGTGNSIYGGDVLNGRNTRIIDVMGTSNYAGIIYFDSTSVWDMQMDNFMRINLTKTFGAGNEPDLATCDEIFSDYFEGVKSFEPTGRVRSVGRNLYDKSKVFPVIYSDGTLHPNAPTETMCGTDFIPVQAGAVYTGFNTTNSTSGIFGIALYDKDKNFVVGQPYNGTGNVLSLFSFERLVTKPIPVGVAYMRWTIRIINGTTTRDDAVIVKGDVTTTPYEPYKETNLYLTAPELRSNGTVKDEIRKGVNGYELVKRISEVDGTVLANPVITPISFGGILNSAENGTVYHEPIIADAGVYDTKMDILLTDYPIATIEEIIKHENGIDTYLNVASAVVASDGLSFTHPDLVSGDLVLFTYAFDKESTNGNITATFYDSNVVKIDTVTGKAYKIEDVVTNGVLTRTLTEV
jgi:hypothetical protein